MPRIPHLSRWSAATLLVAAFLVLPQSVSAQESSLVRFTAVHGSASTPWPAPLDRKVTLRSRDLSLREVLDRLGASARVRLSYSAEAIPLHRSVSVSLVDEPLGSALATVLVGVAVQPVILGSDQVVLAPIPEGSEPASPEWQARTAEARALQGSPAVLDQVVVTGSATGGLERSLPVSLDVVSPAQTVQESATTSMQALVNGQVPGIWVWSQPPTSLLTRYASIRGASSFGVSAPKILVDGVEVANPLVTVQLAPESIERIEVIRGPQGAAFYGADAISGVVNIVTRQDGAAGAPRKWALRTGIGTTGSSYSDRAALTQELSGSLRAGSSARAAGVVIAGNNVGAFVPGAMSRGIFGNAYGRTLASSWILSGTMHVSGVEVSASRNPLLPAVTARAFGQGANSASDTTVAVEAEQSSRQYTVAANATYAGSERWTSTITAGVNGYDLSAVTIDAAPMPSALDSALRAAQGGASRAVARTSSVWRAIDGKHARLSLTGTADYGVLHDRTSSSTIAEVLQHHQHGQGTSPVMPRRLDTQAPAETTYARVPAATLRTAGVSAQANLSLGEAVYLTAGVRGERNSGYSPQGHTASLPMFGISWVHSVNGTTLKLRGAYGEGIRPARTTTRSAAWAGIGAGQAMPDLSPESQRGIEAGVELYHRGLVARATRFDQRASGLIQDVTILLSDSTTIGGHHVAPHFGYVLQNVGAIDNRGWELDGRWHTGSLGVGGTLSIVDSRIARVAPDYTGDLRVGDRMLEVPARTWGGDVTWMPRGWNAVVAFSRAEDWINYDRLALARAFAGATRNPRELTGDRLRSFWIEYPGVTHLRAAVARELRPGFTMSMGAENLLDRQRGEPDNITVVPGRAFTVAARVRF